MEIGNEGLVPRYAFNAYHLNETLKLKDIDRLFSQTARTQSATKLVYQEGEAGFFFIYRFGSVIFFNMEPARQRAVIEKIKMLIGEKAGMIVSDEFYLEVCKGEKGSVGFDKACLGKLTAEGVDLLALILAQSTALEYFEEKVDDILGKAADIGYMLKKKGRLLRSARDIKKFIGQCITTKQQLVGSLYLLDKPDETWDAQELDNLYREAVDIFEIKDRYKTVDYKLRMVQENLELIAELLQHRHANFLEWAIIVLIAVEIVLFIYEIFVMD